MWLKFVFDRVAALAGLLLLWPLMLVLALLIRLKMPDGPVLFRQQRVGRGGRLFSICKFRTMLVAPDGGVEPETSVTVATNRRIPPFAARLRRYHLDELPQLWNVLVGNMSFVGPRPDVPGYADCLVGDDREVLLLRPGITGPATLKYRDEEQLLATVSNPQRYNDEVIYPDKVRLNRYYLHHWSFLTDLRFIWLTLSGGHMHYAGEVI